MIMNFRKSSPCEIKLSEVFSAFGGYFTGVNFYYLIPFYLIILAIITSSAKLFFLDPRLRGDDNQNCHFLTNSYITYLPVASSLTTLPFSKVITLLPRESITPLLCVVRIIVVPRSFIFLSI